MKKRVVLVRQIIGGQPYDGILIVSERVTLEFLNRHMAESDEFANVICQNRGKQTGKTVDVTEIALVDAVSDFSDPKKMLEFLREVDSMA